MIRLAAFDIAGTTIDDRGYVYDALQQAAESFGITVSPESLQANMGREKHEAMKCLLTDGGLTPSDEQVDEGYDKFAATLKQMYTENPPEPIEGVAESIQLARESGIKVALTTGFSQDVATTILDSVGWSVGSLEDGGTVDALVTADQCAAGRPAPYMIFRVMEKTMTEDVAEVMAAGDTVNDLLAGTRAGAGMVVGVLTGSNDKATLEAKPHTHIFPSVVEALEVLLEK